MCFSFYKRHNYINPLPFTASREGGKKKKKEKEKEKEKTIFEMQQITQHSAVHFVQRSFLFIPRIWVYKERTKRIRAYYYFRCSRREELRFFRTCLRDIFPSPFFFFFLLHYIIFWSGKKKKKKKKRNSFRGVGKKREEKKKKKKTRSKQSVSPCDVCVFRLLRKCFFLFTFVSVFPLLFHLFFTSLFQ